jgi:hypothetical protein
MTLLTSLMFAIVAAPSPAYAHTVGGGKGVELELLLLGVVLAGGAIAARPTKEGANSLLWKGLLALGLCFLAAAVIVPRIGGDSASSDASVQIVAPEEGATLDAGEPVEVEVELTNGSLASSAEATSGGHLHLSVDGKLQQMPYSTSMEVTLEEGAQEITVEYVDLEHVSFDPVIEDTIQVTAR